MEVMGVFREKLANRFDIGEPGDFVDTKLAMAGLTSDVLGETGVLIQALPVWKCEQTSPTGYSNPELLQDIARGGIVFGSA